MVSAPPRAAASLSPRLALASIAWMASIAGCSLLTETDGLSGGSSGAVDAAADAATDALSATDAGATDAHDAESGATSCAAGELFCADFDEGAVEKGWDGLSSATGSITADGETFVSPLRSAFVSIPTTPAYVQGIKLSKTMLGTFQTMRCSFAMYRGQIGTGDLTFAKLEVSTKDNNQISLNLSTRPTEGDFSVRRYDAATDTTIPKDVTAPIAFPVGAWHTVVLEIDRSSARLFVDGTMNASVLHEESGEPTSALFMLGGIEIAKNDQPWKLRFDDVRCSRTQ